VSQCWSLDQGVKKSKCLFPQQPHWVPVYRERFVAARSDLPSWIGQRQEPKDCWRAQFPLDLCRTLTCHQTQGQTLGNCSVSVDLALDNMDRQLPSDIRSVLYIALSRATHLKALLVSYISPQVWEKVRGSEDMSQVQASLVTTAMDFASRKGMYDVVLTELKFESDYGNCKQELAELEQALLQPGLVVDAADGQLGASTCRSDIGYL